MARRATASKKAMTGMELVVASDSQLATFEGLFDPEMTAGAEGAGGLAPFISTEDGVFSYKDNVIGKELDAVILGASVEHQLYPGRFVKGQVNSPICFFIGKDESEAAPHEKSPAKQSESCDTCIKNAFGSAGQGSNAKACRQTRRLLILPLGEQEAPDDAQLYRLRVPPTSIKHLSGYDGLVKQYKRPLQSIVTRIWIEDSKTNRFEIKFKALRPVNDRDVLAVLARRAAEGKESLFALPMLKTEPAKGAKGNGRAIVKGGRRVVRR